MNQLLLNDLMRESTKIKDKTLPVIQKVLEDADYILGKELKSFEKEFADYCGVKYAAGVANGTAALYLSMLSLGIGRGDEVITTSMSFAATTEAIIYTGAKPVFIDVNPLTLSIDENQIERFITERTKAILPVHLYGIPAELDRIKLLCNKYNLYLIEDCAQAHGALHGGKKVGSFGNLGCFSFMPAKNLGAYGDAGCVVSDDEELINKIFRLRNHGRNLKYIHEELGYAERMDNLQAAVLRVKLPYLEEWNSRRRQIASHYDNSFKEAGINVLEPSQNVLSCCYVYQVLVDDRDSLIKNLNLAGISTGIYYPTPLHLQPAFKFLGYGKGDFKISEQQSKKLIALPMHPFLEDEEVKYIIDNVIKYVGGKR